MISRKLAYAFGLIALGSSGTYVFVYLFRWEWNRAFMAGIIFIAAEIGIAAVVLLERIKAIEKAIEHQDPASTAEHIRETAPPSPDRFQWLKRSDVGVFIPFLLGAGVLASGIAWAVERVAGATIRPAGERKLALRLAPIALPAGGFVGEGPGTIATDLTPVPRPNFGRSTIRKQVVALVLAILLGTVGLDVLADATQTRPDRLVPGTTTAVIVELSLHKSGLSAAEGMDSLWGTCRNTVPNKLTDAGIVALGGLRFELTFTPALGKNGYRRLHGCFEDAVLDNLQARVLPAAAQ